MEFHLDWLASKPFKFTVDDQPIYVHRDLISGLSPPLDRLINGKLKEAQDQAATLPGVDFDTFSRFAQWAYTGHYAPANPTRKAVNEADDDTKPSTTQPEVEPRSEEELAIQDEEFWAFSSAAKSKKKKDPPPQPVNPLVDLRQSFSRLSFPISEHSAQAFSPRKNDAQSEDFTRVLLSHVKLYVFADEKDVQELKRLALHQLHQTLSHFDSTPQSVQELVPMIEYVYEHTRQPSNSKEPMRLMVSTFVGSIMDKLVTAEGFKDLFLNADFAGDFCAELDTYFALARGG